MAKLRHPNILPIYTVGEGEGLAFFIMPLVEGLTLKQAMQQARRFAIPDARRILFEAGSALHHAHLAGAIHRDIKPDNIILEGPERRALVMDFGIAKAMETGEGELTGSGVIIGTPQYMSPEQATGDPLDTRSDLYSLGVVAFQMLTGELPFTASSPQGVILKHVTAVAPRVEELRPECPRDLAEAVARCLAKEPGERFASAADLCAALRSGEVAPGGAAARVSVPTLPGGLAPVRVRDPVRRFRRSLAVYLAGNGVVLAVDVALNGVVDFAPVVAALWTVLVASQYAGLWMEGFAWRDVLGVRPRGGGHPSGPTTPPGVVWSSGTHTTPADSGAFGAHLGAVDQVRSERAVIVGLVARMPKAERQLIPQVVPSADRLAAQSRSLARQLTRLERVIEETRQRSAGSTGGARTPPDVTEFVERRDEISQALEQTRQAMQSLRVAVERCQALGVSGARTDLQVAVRTAEDRARSPK
jgi:serine/threonine-protein kinase